MSGEEVSVAASCHEETTDYVLAGDSGIPDIRIGYNT